jgi:hypothetical protein
MTSKLDSLRALHDTVKAGDIDRAVMVSRGMSSAARDLGRHEDLSPLTIEKVMIRGSLDAAHALHKAVLPGWDYRLGRDEEDFHALVFVSGRMDAHKGDWEMCQDYPARAWLLAILAALIAQEEAA